MDGSGRVDRGDCGTARQQTHCVPQRRPQRFYSATLANAVVWIDASEPPDAWLHAAATESPPKRPAHQDRSAHIDFLLQRAHFNLN